MKTITKIAISTACLISFIHVPLFSQPTGNITYALIRESNPTQDQADAYQKIKTAMDSAVGYYNKYTTITKSLNVYYNTDVPTADGNSNGTIRFGANRSYMLACTAMHEIAHTVGIGTTSEYQNLIQNGIFIGLHATAVLREISADPTALLKGDKLHFWPYGLNYASEVSGVNDLISHCSIVNAIYHDMFIKEELFGVYRLRARNDGRFMVASNGNTLTLGNSTDSTSLVRMISLDEENTFRLEFGSKVLDIPGVSTASEVAAGLWDWKGGANQKTIFEFETSTKNSARIRMKHSNLYLRANGDNIIQDSAGILKESQYWELIGEKENPVQLIKHHYCSLPKDAIKIQYNNIHVEQAIINNSTTTFEITDLSGRIIRSGQLKPNTKLSTSEFSHGLYLIQIQFEQHTLNKKFVIQ